MLYAFYNAFNLYNVSSEHSTSCPEDGRIGMFSPLKRKKGGGEERKERKRRWD